MTWVSERSGIASTGMVRSSSTPVTNTKTAPRATSSRRRIDQAIRRSIMGASGPCPCRAFPASRFPHPGGVFLDRPDGQVIVGIDAGVAEVAPAISAAAVEARVRGFTSFEKHGRGGHAEGIGRRTTGDVRADEFGALGAGES